MFISKLLRIPITVILDTVKLIIIFMPGSFGNKLRRLYYRKKLKRMGKNVVIDVGVQIDGPELISIGNNVHIDKYCIISTGKKLVGNVIKNKASFRDDNAEIIIGNKKMISVRRKDVVLRADTRNFLPR